MENTLPTPIAETPGHGVNNLAAGASFVPRPKMGLTSLDAVAYTAQQQEMHGHGGAQGCRGPSCIPGELSREVLRNLARSSITTVEELLGLADVDRRLATEFAAELGISASTLSSLRSNYVRTETGSAEIHDWERFGRYEYALGFDLGEGGEPVEHEHGPGAAAPENVHPGGVNLADACLPPVRDQQERGTCTAFASVACLEHHLCRTTGSAQRLSEQFQYWNMVERSGRHSLAACFPMLATDGVCRGATWEYSGKPIVGNDAQGPPPSGAVAEAGGYRCDGVLRLPPRSVPAIQQALHDDHLVAVGFPVYRSWLHNPVVRKYGNITLPIPGEIPEIHGHAVALVGFGDDSDFAGGGFFVVRNSWNHRWGTGSVFGSGYGTLPYSYIARLNWDAWCISG